MTILGKIRRKQIEPHLRSLEDKVREETVACARRVAEICNVESILDEIDAAVAAGEFESALQLLDKFLAAYVAVKSTSREEALKNLGLAELVMKLKGE